MFVLDVVVPCISILTAPWNLGCDCSSHSIICGFERNGNVYFLQFWSCFCGVGVGFRRSPSNRLAKLCKLWVVRKAKTLSYTLVLYSIVYDHV